MVAAANFFAAVFVVAWAEASLVADVLMAGVEVFLDVEVLIGLAVADVVLAFDGVDEVLVVVAVAIFLGLEVGTVRCGFVTVVVVGILVT